MVFKAKPLNSHSDLDEFQVENLVVESICCDFAIRLNAQMSCSINILFMAI